MPIRVVWGGESEGPDLYFYDHKLIGSVNYKLTLAQIMPVTEGQGHLPSASVETEPYAAAAIDLQNP